MAVLWCLRDREPAYKGQSLRVWIQPYFYATTGKLVLKDSDEAVRHMGSNAVPALLKMIRAEDSPLKLKIIEWTQGRHLAAFKFQRTDDRKIDATCAFRALGAEGKSGVPELVRILGESRSITSQIAAEKALSGIGPAASKAIPALARATSSTNIFVRKAALEALKDIRASPEAALPVFTKFMSDPSSYIRRSALEGLIALGPQARPAIPEIVALLKSDDLGIRGDAAELLKQIDPDAAVNAGVK
jgi:HEAT repeat protein